MLYYKYITLIKKIVTRSLIYFRYFLIFVSMTYQETSIIFLNFYTYKQKLYYSGI